MDNIEDITGALINDPRIKKGLEAYAKTMESQAAGTRNLVYYNKEQAIWVKEILDTLHKDRQPIKLSAQGMSINTLRLKYYQGLKYLKEVIDPEGRYKLLSQATRCVTYCDYVELHVKIKAKAFVSVVTDWKTPLLQWLEKPDLKLGEKFSPVGVVLSDDEVNWVITQVEPLKEIFLYRVTNTEILIVRYNTPTNDNTRTDKPAS